MTNIALNDEISTWVYDPNDFEPTAGQVEFKRLKISNSMIFTKDANGRRYVSVNLNRLANPFPERLHALGQRKERKKQERQKADGKVANYTYVGFLSADCAGILAVKQNGVTLSVYSDPFEEDGILNDAHCHIEMVFGEAGYSKNVATYIKTKLEEVFGEDLVKPDPHHDYAKYLQAA